jgi:4-hydroxy-tetrahydrodipicolinate reductase
MAREVAIAAFESPHVQLETLVARTRPDWLVDEQYYTSLEDIESLPDLLIDFTLSGGTYDAAHWCRASLVPLVSGTTGLSNADRKALFETAELVPVMWAPNLSKGLNLVMKSVVEAAVALPVDTPVEIFEVHHVHKKDAPSGTALLLARAIASARGQELETHLNIITGSASRDYAPGSINCVSLREGDVIGDHQVRFLAGDEEILVKHTAANRAIYALGSLEAGLWLLNQPAGLYSSTDWLAS